jgi:hypothetical protein
MRRVVPFKTTSGALRSLDNGGRFYNMLTKAGDGSITNAELNKAAGVSSGRHRALLYLNLALSGLGAAGQHEVISHLSDDLRLQLNDNRPQRVPISRFETEVSTTLPVIVEGYPRFIEDRTEFQAFIMFPIMAGKVMTFAMIPIFDKYDIYEVYSNSTFGGGKTIIATVRGSRRLQNVRTTFGGIVKELKFDPKTKTSHRFYIESLYYAVDPDGHGVTAVT